MEGTNYWLQLQQTQTTDGITPQLSRQINLLGILLGEIVASNASPEMLALVEDLRTQCKAAELEHSTAILQSMAATLEKLPLEKITWLLRVYTLFFQLVNQAEVQEMIRINHERDLQSTASAPRKESVMAAILELKNAGYSYQQVIKLLEQCDLQFTFTAHPTEARRQTVLRKQEQIGQYLQALNQPLSEQEQSAIITQLKAQITLLLYTDNVRSQRVTVADEVRNGLYYLMHAVWQALPQLYHDLEYALNLYYGKMPNELPTIIRYRSWIGADGDGNPNITPTVIQETIQRHMRAALKNYLEALADLELELSISEQKVKTSENLCRSLAQDQQLLQQEFNTITTPKQELYRLKVHAIRLKLLAKLAMLELTANELQQKIGHTVTASSFLADLTLLQDSLNDSGLGDVAQSGLLANIIVQAKTFGFHLATLDLRQHSGVHETALTDVLSVLNITPNYARLTEPEKIALLHKLDVDKKLMIPDLKKLQPATVQLLETFAVIKNAPAQAIGSYIVSMTHHLSDILAVVFFNQLIGVEQSKIDIIPLFETISDLAQIETLLTAMYTDPVYRQQLVARGQFQEILLGYSDSNKDGGYWAANYLLHQAQTKAAQICQQYKIEYRLFHGRGGSTGRGGGRVYDSMLVMPSNSQNNRIRMTEQGEVISFHYQSKAMAKRHYEQTLYALLIASMPQKTVQWTTLDPAVKSYLSKLTENSIDTYRSLIAAPAFWSWYIQITPIEFISKLPIASRPVMRKAANEVDFTDLRAIPWVFSWSQTRLNVPGWFGIGHALQQLLQTEPVAQQVLNTLYQEWDFFKLMLANIQQEMAKAHLLIAQFYDHLAPNKKLFDLIQQDFEYAQAAILAITQESTLLENNQLLQKSIRLRNPYTDVLNLLQIELMKRFHDKKDKELFEPALLLSLNGLASALQSTG